MVLIHDLHVLWLRCELGGHDLGRGEGVRRFMWGGIDFGKGKKALSTFSSTPCPQDLGRKIFESLVDFWLPPPNFRRGQQVVFCCPEANEKECKNFKLKIKKAEAKIIINLFLGNH